MPEFHARISPRDWLIAVVSSVAVLLLHLGFDGFADDAGYFVKYSIAVQQVFDGSLPLIRLIDLSPLYFELSLWVGRMFSGIELALRAMGWIHRGTVAASAGLLYLVLVSRLPRAWAVGGVVAFAFEPHVLIYERIFEPEVVLVFWLLGSLVAVARFSSPSAALAGGFAACAIATRPTFLPLFVVLGPLFYGLHGNRGRVLLTRSAAFLLPVILCALLLGSRAERITGDWSSPVMNPGTVFFEGSHPLSRGTSAAYPPIVASMIVNDPNVPDEAHVRYRRVATQELRRNLSIREVNAFWAGKALAFIRAEPGRYFGVVLDKASRIFQDYRWHDTDSATQYDRALPSLSGVFAGISALAWIGFILELPRWRENLFLYAYAVTQVAVMLVFYVSARQQMVLIPPLIFFAVAALHTLVERRGRAIAWGVPLLVLFVLFMGRNDMVRDNIHREIGGRRAQVIGQEIEGLSASAPLAAHRELLAKLLASASWLVDQNVPGNVDQQREPLSRAAVRTLRGKPDRDFFDEFDLATLELRAGELQQATVRFERLAEDGRLPYRGYLEASDPLFYLGRIAGLQGRGAAAIEYLERALARTPGDPYVLAELAVLQGAPEYRRLIESYYSTLDMHLLLGEAYLLHGRAQEAVFELKALVKNLPRSHRGSVALAVAYGKTGQYKKGVAMYQQSLKIDSLPVIWSSGVVELFEHWAESHPADEAVQFEAARILYFHGRFGRALERILAIESDTDQVRSMIQKIRRSLAQVPPPV